MQLDRFPSLSCRGPGMRCGLPGRERGQFIAWGDAAGVDLADSRTFPWRSEVHCRRTVAEGHIDRPRRSGIRFIVPDESWRCDLRRKDRPILRIVHRNRSKIGEGWGEDEVSLAQAGVKDAPRKNAER